MGYALPNAWELAERRLALLEASTPGPAALEDHALWFYGPARIIAWGRRC